MRKKNSVSFASAFTIATATFLLLSSLNSDLNANTKDAGLSFGVADAESSSATTSAAMKHSLKNVVDDREREGMEIERYHRNKNHNRNSHTEQEHTSSSSDSNTHNVQDQDVIIVATVDGTFYGLSQRNGQVLWKSHSKSDATQNPTYSKGKEQTGPQTTTHGDLQGVHQQQHNRMANKHKPSTHAHTKQQESENIIFAPLIQTSTTRSSTTNSVSSWRTSAVPSIDGRVFLTLGGVNGNGRQTNDSHSSSTTSSSSSSSSSTKHHSKNQKDLFNYAIADTTITTSMKDLVNRSPFMDSRGRFYVSSRDTYAVAIDRDTGDVVKVVNGSKYLNGRNDGPDVHSKHKNGANHDQYGDSNDNNGNDDYYDFEDIFDYEKDTFCNSHREDEYCHGHNHDDKSDKERNLIWMGRVDYSVSVHDARTGDLDVEFSTSEVLSLDDMIGAKHQINGSNSAGGIGSTANHGSDDGNLAQNNGMLRLPAGEGEEEEEDHVRLGQLNDSLISSKIVTSPGGKVALIDPKTGEVIWIVDDTFNTPVAFAVESSSGSSIGVHVVADAANSKKFSKEHVSNELDKELSDNAFFGPGADDHLGMGGTVFGALETGQLFALPLGGQRSNPHLLNGLPHTPLLSTTAGKTKHPMGKIPLLSTPGDLRQYANDKDSYALALKRNHCDRNSVNYPECILESYIKSSNDWFLDNGNVNLVPDPDFPFQQLNYPQPRERTKTNIFVKLMTSWIPPAVALAFVVSFELGRREKLRVETVRSRQESRDESDKEQSDKSLTRLSDGVIDVSDEVLGFGGHGTVVYKGKLEGRHVAVKRMLKAYHASADREISLLIESDGHPNVVRYFLKELRGDFVYLALELCDMNLQDLITVLTKNRLKNLPPQSKERPKQIKPVDDATKQLLFEIASGIKHIHSLRIVHRDLKPANILLARKNRVKCEGENSIYDAFQAQDFVVKISDMGLGKQLLGQSSFGMSTMTNAVEIGMSRNEGSTIAGNGPGSVGWQAPEVMAHRLSPESPLLYEEGSTSEGMLEASPINSSLNGRTSRSVDIFSLGCVFFCTVLPGSHPFGEWYEREANIMKNCPTTRALQDVTLDAADLILSMLNRSPRSRPTASQICHHPFFWNPMKRLAFLCDLSDRLEIADSDTSNFKFDPYIIERNATSVVGTSWDTKLDAGFFNHVTKFRKYDAYSVKDCLRLIRNKHHHFDELPNDLKQRVCKNQEELLKYFERVFPRLLMHCYNICREHLIFNDTLNKKYAIPSKVGKKIVDKEKVHISASKSSDLEVSPKTASKLQLETPKKHNGETLEKQFSSDSENTNISKSTPEKSNNDPTIDVVMWQNSAAASSFQCRGWIRSEEEWMRGGKKSKKIDVNLARCAKDGKFRTRLCNHWDESQGTFCAMRKKNKCDFAHGPIELRVKEGKRNRWGKLVDTKGNNSNPRHSGGEDTYGAARSIETARKEEGKWNTGMKQKKGRKKTNKNQS